MILVSIIIIIIIMITILIIRVIVILLLLIITIIIVTIEPSVKSRVPPLRVIWGPHRETPPSGIAVYTG